MCLKKREEHVSVLLTLSKVEHCFELGTGHFSALITSGKGQNCLSKFFSSNVLPFHGPGDTFHMLNVVLLSLIKHIFCRSHLPFRPPAIQDVEAEPAKDRAQTSQQAMMPNIATISQTSQTFLRFLAAIEAWTLMVTGFVTLQFQLSCFKVTAVLTLAPKLRWNQASGLGFVTHHDLAANVIKTSPWLWLGSVCRPFASL
jgi:hypothetical protein